MMSVTLSPNLYCPFCGVLLQCQFFDPSAPAGPILDKPWLQEIRAVFTSDATLAPPSLSGVGFLSMRTVLSAPLDCELSYRDADPVEEIAIFQRGGVLWGYGFHDACWKVVLLRLPGVTKTHPDMLRSIFDLLYNTQCLDFSSFWFGHDYDGAASTHKPFGLPKPIDQSSSFYANPSSIPTFAELESSAPESVYLPSPPKTIPSRSCASDPGDVQGLAGLPLEVLQLVISYLSLTEVVNIRLVCRRFSVEFKYENLPQSFWVSRFMIGSDMDYIFPDFRTKRDWSKLYLGTRASMKSGNPSLANRKRILTLIEPMACLLELRSLGSRELWGLQVLLRDPDETGAHEFKNEHAEYILGDYTATQSFSGQLAPRDYDNQLEDGCRAQQRRMCQFPFHIANGAATPQKQRFGASAITIGTQSYICGISTVESQYLSDLPCRVGYYVPSTEKIFDVPCHGQIGAIEVAFCASGLVGIRFVCVHGDTSVWVGRCEGLGIAQGLLRLSPGNDKCGFVAGLDAYKIVSLALFSAQENTNMTRMRSYDESCNGSNRIESHLWTPQRPMHEKLAISVFEPLENDRPFNPIVNIDFGGPGGVLLASLTRVVVHMVSEYCPIIGFEFVYDDRTLKFGSGGKSEISALIDGPGGERIINVQVIIQDSRIGMGGVQIETSYGYTHILAPMPQSQRIRKARLGFKEGHMITGFLAIQARRGKQWRRLGLQSQPQSKQLVIPRPVIQDPIYHLLESRLDYDKEFAICICTSFDAGIFRTYASLENVRRIQASCGLSQRSRSVSHISGLRLDYYNQCSPAIVGQWMKANGDYDTFEVNEGEKINGLTIWLSKEGESSEIRGLRQGKVVAIRVDTSRHRSKLFKSHKGHLPFLECLLQQYQTDMYDEITAMLWMFNSSYDRVQAVTTSNKSMNPPLLVAEHPPPFDQVQKLLFENFRHDGSTDKLVSIVGHLHQRRVTGISFLYQSGAATSVGFTATDTHQTIQMMDGECIVRFTAGRRDSELRLLEFRIDFNEDGLPKSRIEIITTNPDEHRASMGFYHQDTWYAANTTNLDVTRISSMDRQYSCPPGAKFVGIFVRCQEFRMMGAIYQSLTPVSTSN